MTGGVILGPGGEVLSSPPARRVVEPQPLKARFDAAQTTLENTRHWAAADYLGPNAELDPGVRRTLRSRARYEAANNSYLSGMLRTIAADTIGTGPGLQITDPEVGTDDARTIETRFWQWCLAIRLPQKLRLMRQAKARDGESFAQLFENPRVRDPVKLDFNPFEADLVATTTFSNSLSNILDGLYVDDFGNVLAYNVLSQHPGENVVSLATEAEIIPADRIIHLFHADRTGQYRGCPEITPALPLFAQLRRYTLAVLRCAESAALPTWLLGSQQPPSDMAYGDPWETLETERGMGMVLPEGYDLAQLKAEQPTDTYPAFKREILSEIARCLGLPYNIAAGDSSSYNYSSGRLDHRGWYKSRRVERSYIEAESVERLAAGWWTEGTRLDDYLPESVRDLKAPPLHEWVWDGEEHIDPLKESKADQADLESGATTLATIYGRKGQDWEAALRQRAREVDLCRELGLPIPGEKPGPDTATAVQDAMLVEDQPNG